jgi:hypothetical protein
MLDRKLAAAVALAAALMTIGGARASDDAKYPTGKANGRSSPLLRFLARRPRVGTRPNLGDWDNKRR